MTHTPGMEHSALRATPVQAGQAIFAALTEITRQLEADSSTDWTKVDLEALRQHLIDMDNVTRLSRVVSVPISGGVQLQVTGDRAVAASIRRMISRHAKMLEAEGAWRVTTAPIAGGLAWRVVASDSANTAAIARIRGLGFAGLLVYGDHHTRHHMMIARGAGAHAHEM